MTVSASGKQTSSFMKNRPKSRSFVPLWMLVLPTLGAAGAYFAAVRGGHSPPATMALVGAVWGAFIGVLFSMEISRVVPPLRRYIGAGFGLVASAISGFLLDWQVISIIGVGIVAAVLGVFADLWVRHIADFP